MIFTELRIQNFRSFGKTQTFVFPQEPGLYFMSGRNEAEPRLDANGAGKSTIWDALTWCIFGKTPKGLKAGDVNNWEAGKNTRVELDFTSPSGEDCTMVRSWKPNTWTLQARGGVGPVDDLTKSADNFFLGWLGLDFAPFLNAVLMAQGQPMFLDMKAEPQAALFSEVMGLDRWMEASGKASKKASDQDRVSRALERTQAAIRGELEGLGREDLKSSLQRWEEERSARLHKIDATIVGYEMHSSALEDVEHFGAVELERRAELDAAELPLAGLDQARAEAQALESKLRRELDLLKRDLEHEDEHFDALESGEPCPKCGHKLSARELDEALDKQVRRLEKLKKETTAAMTAYQEARTAVQAANKALDEHDAVRDVCVKRLRKAEDEAARARQALQQEERDIKRLNKEFDDVQAETNPYAAMEKRARQNLERLNEELAATERQLDASNSKMGLYSYWVRGFKELRLQQIAEALTELEIEVNSSVEALGLVGWQLNFQVDRETKGGSIQRGFSVAVRSPHNSLAVPWEAWSGGEAQRLRLAANMGLSDLIRSRTGASLPLEVWDEPTEGLSHQGIQDLLETLETRARVEQRQIWVVDHRAHAFGGFAGGAEIIKTNSGSRIRQS
jgi:DNA repair exonuclease SbcCD ATPase subunit